MCKPAGLANTRILTDDAPKTPRSLVHGSYQGCILVIGSNLGSTTGIDLGIRLYLLKSSGNQGHESGDKILNGVPFNGNLLPTLAPVRSSLSFLKGTIQFPSLCQWLNSSSKWSSLQWEPSPHSCASSSLSFCGSATSLIHPYKCCTLQIPSMHSPFRQEPMTWAPLSHQGGFKFNALSPIL